MVRILSRCGSAAGRVIGGTWMIGASSIIIVSSQAFSLLRQIAV